MEERDQLKETVWEEWRLERKTSFLTGENRGRAPSERCSVEITASWLDDVRGGRETDVWRERGKSSACCCKFKFTGVQEHHSASMSVLLCCLSNSTKDRSFS